MSDPASVAAFREFVASLVERSGFAEVVYVAREGRGEVRAGWSPRSNLAFIIGSEGSYGVAPDGRAFHTKTTFGSTSFEVPAPGGINFVDPYFPGHELVDLSQRPEWIASCEKTADGGFVVAWTGPGGARLTREQMNLPANVDYPEATVTLTVSPTGTVLKRHKSASGKNSEESVEFKYRPDSDGLLASPESSGPFTLRSIRLEATTDVAVFEPGRIESMAVATSLSVSRQKVADATTAATQDLAKDGAPDSSGSVSIPLLGTGLLLIVVAGLAYLKRRG